MASTFRRALVTGSTGFLGHHVVAEAARRGLEVVTAGRRECDVTLDLESVESVAAAVARVAPDLILHVGAMSAMGACAREPERAMRVNGAAVCGFERANARLVHVSTDLVFDGRSAPYLPRSIAAPLSAYGASKLAGERSALACPDALVVRLPLLFGTSFDGRRGATDMLRPDRELTLFINEFRTPLDVADAARALLDFAEFRDRRGIAHAAGPERLSRFEFARRFARLHGLDGSRWRPVVCTDPSRPRDVSLISDWSAPPLDESLARLSP
ncbi:MAG: SDR family oxidoreductase [Planctomycetes bacterium]|nr:SDR family oxidoreductase [Planctomycetota bacterium]